MSNGIGPSNPHYYRPSFTTDGKDKREVANLKLKLFRDHEKEQLSKRFSRVDHRTKEPFSFVSEMTYWRNGEPDCQRMTVFATTVIPIAMFHTDTVQVGEWEYEEHWSFFFKTDEEAIEFKLKYL